MRNECVWHRPPDSRLTAQINRSPYCSKTDVYGPALKAISMVRAKRIMINVVVVWRMVGFVRETRWTVGAELKFPLLCTVINNRIRKAEGCGTQRGTIDFLRNRTRVRSRTLHLNEISHGSDLLDLLIWHSRIWSSSINTVFSLIDALGVYSSGNQKGAPPLDSALQSESARLYEKLLHLPRECRP